jgi:hypothetical protein
LILESEKERTIGVLELLPCRPAARTDSIDESDKAVNNKSLIINRLFKGLFQKHTRTGTHNFIVASLLWKLNVRAKV